MDHPGSGVRFTDVISTRAGRFYAGALVGLTVGFFRGSAGVPSGAEPPTLSVALSVAMVAFLVVLGVMAFYLPQAYIVWILLRNALAAVAVFCLTVLSMMLLGVATPAGIYETPLLRLLLSSVSALLLAEALTLCILLVVMFTRGAGGNGETPEEQVLDDDLDL
jgi:hypothetical protein